MKYSFMSFSCPDLDLAEMLALAARLGYDGVEPRVAAKHKHLIELEASAADRAAAKATVAASGVPLSCLATSCRYADPETTGEHVEATHAYIDLAADLGAPCIRVFGGAIGGGLDRDQAIVLVADSLASVADHAAERGVVVCMETHDDWCDPTHVAAVVGRVDHPNIAVNWDVMHPVRTAGYAMADAHPPIARWVRHVHFHDGARVDDQVNLVPIGEGFIDHRTAVKILLGVGYDGFLSGEWINWSIGWDTHLPAEIATMKGYEREE